MSPIPNLVRDLATTDRWILGRCPEGGAVLLEDK